MRENDLIEQKTRYTIAETKCPLCGKEESIQITEPEIMKAKKDHKLIAKAIQHEVEGHILALYVDTEGKVRRRYCFEITKKKHFNITKRCYWRSRGDFCENDTKFTKIKKSDP